MDLGLLRLSDAAQPPRYATPGSVAFDIATSEAITIARGEIAFAKTGWVFAVPAGACLIVALRSSTPRKYGVVQPHGIGLIDQDYRGPDDEVAVPLLNFRATAVTIPHGARIAQGLLVPIERATLVPHQPSQPNRGGFGSTGYD
jgi:dUTP diphosphatase